MESVIYSMLHLVACVCAETFKITIGEGRSLKRGRVPTYITVVSETDCLSPCQRLRRA
jgi:hypothetical protein